MKILTFDIGGTFIKYGVCNDKFKLLEAHKIPTHAEKAVRSL
jgi:predicted NBD/HSP70 family sugar kinase